MLKIKLRVLIRHFLLLDRPLLHKLITVLCSVTLSVLDSIVFFLASQAEQVVSLRGPRRFLFCERLLHLLDESLMKHSRLAQLRH